MKYYIFTEINGVKQYIKHARVVNKRASVSELCKTRKGAMLWTSQDAVTKFKDLLGIGYAIEAVKEADNTTIADLLVKSPDLKKHIEVIRQSIIKQLSEQKIQVHVRGGVAYCDDARVEIIDHDNNEREALRSELKNEALLDWFPQLPTSKNKDHISVVIDDEEPIYYRNDYNSILDSSNRENLALSRELDRAFELIDEVVNTI